MHRVAKLATLGTVAALLSACGGTGSSLPSTSQNQTTPQAQAVYPRAAIGSDGHVVVYFYNQAIEKSGLVTPGVVGTRIHTMASGPLLYGGGPIQTAPKIYVDFWGSGWNSSSGDPDGVATYYDNFANLMIGSSWMSTVTQYYQTLGGTTSYVGNASTALGGTWVHAVSLPNLRAGTYQSAYANEAKNAAAHFGNYSDNASYVIIVPHGTKVNGFGTSYCAWHSDTSSTGGTISYTNLPYIPDAGSSCGANSVNSNGTDDGVSIVGGHEQAETETDPQPSTGWTNSSGSEIGDLCAWVNLQDNSYGGTTLGVNYFPNQPLWSNSANGCVQ
jgi:hypothetical protein